MSWCVYDKDHKSALRIKNTSESDPHSYEVINLSKAQKNFWGFKGIWIHDLCNTGVKLYQLSYEASECD